MRSSVKEGPNINNLLTVDDKLRVLPFSPKEHKSSSQQYRRFISTALGSTRVGSAATPYFESGGGSVLGNLMKDQDITANES